MKVLLKVGVVALFLTPFLAGCATTQVSATQTRLNNKVYQHSLPMYLDYAVESKPANSMVLLKQAMHDQSTGTLVSAGLRNPKTVFVPSAYSDTIGGKLFIKGTQYTAPQGYTNVAGFLETSYGYLVAVIQPYSRTATSSRWMTAYYQVSRSGKTLKRLATLPVTNNVFVTRHAIYSDHLKSNGLIDYTGVRPSGGRISGPQNTLSAAPLKNGGWLVLKPWREGVHSLRGWKHIGNGNSNDVTHRMSIVYYQTPAGVTQILGSSPMKKFIHTNAVFVNTPNYIDSARTNTVWAIAYYKVNADGNVFQSAPFGVLISGRHAQLAPGYGILVPSPKGSRGPQDLVSHKIMSRFNLGVANGRVVSQWQDSDNGNWIYMSNPLSNTAPKYYVMPWRMKGKIGSGIFTLHGGDVRIAQYIQTPNSVIIYRNRSGGGSSLEDGFRSQGLAYNLGSRRYISTDTMLNFLSRYGVKIGVNPVRDQ